MKVTMIEIKLSTEEYLTKIRPCLKDIINNFKKSNTWKIQLAIAINFISSKDNDQERVMQSKSDNREFMIYDNADEVIEELFEPLINRYQIRLETSMTGSDITFDCAHLMEYKCRKLNPNSGESYIDFPDKNDDKCFQYAVTDTLNHEEIRKIKKIKN